MNFFTTRFDRSMWGSGLAAACAWLAVLGATTTARGQCNPQEVAHLFASDGTASDFFGRSLAISGDTLVVGASDDDTAGGTNAGSAYVFVLSGGVWTQQSHLFASDGAASDFFASSLTIAGDTAVVGAPGDDTLGGLNAGSAYVFVRSGGVWTEQVHLFASDGAAGDIFGSWSAIAVSGDTVVVGAQEDDTLGGANAGSAYVFDLSGGVWTESAHLFASDGAVGDNFGYAVEISGDTVVVGALLDDTLLGGVDAGSAYVFVRNAAVWTEQAHLFASDGAADDRFTTDIAISGDTVVVGAARDDTPLGGVNAGSAYVFVRDGVVWTEHARLFASDGAAEDRFGYSVEMFGETVVVGAWADDTLLGGTDAGSAYVLDINCQPVCPADLTGDGLVNVNDLLAVINGWGPCPLPCPPHCAPDVSPVGGDCQVNVNDLLVVINAWGPC